MYVYITNSRKDGKKRTLRKESKEEEQGEERRERKGNKDRDRDREKTLPSDFIHSLFPSGNSKAQNYV